jgi:hypothetical protein
MIVIFTATGELGCTFLNWSFHWLSGDEYSWEHKKGSWVKLPSNPLTEHNAHLFEKNFYNSFEEWKKTTNTFLGFDIEKKDFTFFGSCYDELQSKIKFVLDKKIKIIFLGCDYSGYKLFKRTDFSVFQSRRQRYLNLVTSLKTYFHTVPKIESLVDSPLKARNFLSLSLKHLKKTDDLQLIQKENFESDKNFLFINLRNFLLDGEKCLRGVFNFLGRKIDQNRLNQWIPIHARWKKFLLPTLNFYDDLPVILASIINGSSHSLKKYRLDIFTEAIIQHELMKQHRDRLLIGHLNKFPDNTKDLTPFLKSVIVSR